jgi:hypothetical protein
MQHRAAVRVVRQDEPDSPRGLGRVHGVASADPVPSLPRQQWRRPCAGTGGTGPPRPGPNVHRSNRRPAVCSPPGRHTVTATGGNDCVADPVRQPGAEVGDEAGDRQVTTGQTMTGTPLAGQAAGRTLRGAVRSAWCPATARADLANGLLTTDINDLGYRWIRQPTASPASRPARQIRTGLGGRNLATGGRRQSRAIVLGVTTRLVKRGRLGAGRHLVSGGEVVAR